MEKWLPVVGFESLYSVSSFGRIKRTANGGRAQIGRILAVQTDKQGYVRIKLSHNGTAFPRKIYRLVAEAFIGPIPNGMTVNHKNGDKGNNRVENLEIVSRADNVRHAFRVLGTASVRGERNPRAILNEERVREIRRRLDDGEGISQVARDVGFNKHTIYDIKHRRSWAHV
ncbi:MAG: NUMOD4 motif-containing HNH endonuclease [Burkholderiaceae bacterium]|nr:NUMOD4 motif-containing HNH endonuclease [Burkholderiaceae bacterium]